MMNIVVVGGGHAAAQLSASLAEHALPAKVTLVTEEAHLPYHRPPLSKAYLKDAEPAAAWLRSADFYAGAGAQWRLSSRVVRIVRDERRIELAGAESLPYDRLVLATGARARSLPGLQEGLGNVHTLRNLDDAARLRHRLSAAESVLVIGGGFIGLEIAATAAQLGKRVVVLEAAARLLSRSASPEVSDYLLASHRAAGVDIRLNTAIEAFDVQGGQLVAVRTAQGAVPADLVVVGIGAVPNDELARQAGLLCDNGIVVDAHMATSDPAILAIGDCTAFPFAPLGRRIRLESVQNANDQARCAALALAGTAEAYSALPWFWSEQGALRIQIAGVPEAHHERIVRGDPGQGRFSVLHFRDDTLSCVESVNVPADHMAARKLIAEACRVPRDKAVDASIPLKSLA
ncbi:NAD(P)/FAD-dependent oxidoreductase [Pusillimonas noertemannii]|uniref:3-phenylpropionate/trans-cinnamate dioxygenase ferredoxin reductase subunit n=1 Tax=Pusillimonas noertemannii TaxID=305977 RepID=A0A2U1CIU0_9BURK|nr:FAD-dependent oxidoreductase [Pusillimonas noertemannii]NYT70746.1 FAD-dependent oxidoreductase [Pusillimonas noertemannii]PVY60904.1 3-phenylpropionate/trans-cinnamate dioxygenase ferredoxin reductase subunit [Pusillimonas noertemannii]TFL08507.1 ferredoxin reductase [Pusillimonas noertemannii]